MIQGSNPYQLFNLRPFTLMCITQLMVQAKEHVRRQRLFPNILSDISFIENTSGSIAQSPELLLIDNIRITFIQHFPRERNHVGNKRWRRCSSVHSFHHLETVEKKILRVGVKKLFIGSLSPRCQSSKLLIAGILINIYTLLFIDRPLK